MRSKKALINTIVGLCYEVVSLVCGMILPRLILGSFGSNYNGITSSITQFLSCIALLRSGISGVTRAALYKPLAEENTLEINKILRATEIFMHRIAFIFLIFILAFACVYPVFVKSEFSWFFSSSLVLILGISTFAEYYFGFTYQILLTADQKQYIISLITIFTTIFNTFISSILINLGAGIHLVKLLSALVFALNPIFIHLYTRKKYKLTRKVEPDNEVISQRWDAFAHQVAGFVNTNTDVILLTIFTNVREVSVYAVYNMILSGLNRLLKNTIPGVSAAFGNMIAKGETELLKKNFKIYEVIIYSLTTILFVTAGIMIVPFVMLYTKGVVDADYSRELFATVIVIASFFGCVRLPYQQIVEALGHYKETKKGAYFESLLNITISTIFVFKFGLVGVAIGTLAATLFRTVQYATYLSDKIIFREKWYYIKHILISGVIAVVVIIIYSVIPKMEYISYLDWIINAFFACGITTVLVVISNFVFYKDETLGLVRKFKFFTKKKK